MTKICQIHDYKNIFVFTKAEKAGCSCNKQAQNLSEKLLCVHFYYLILVNSTRDTFTDWFPFYSLQCVKMTVHKNKKIHTHSHTV